MELNTVLELINCIFKIRIHIYQKINFFFYFERYNSTSQTLDLLSKYHQFESHKTQEVYIVVNFRTHEISRDAHKLVIHSR